VRSVVKCIVFMAEEEGTTLLQLCKFPRNPRSSLW